MSMLAGGTKELNPDGNATEAEREDTARQYLFFRQSQSRNIVNVAPPGGRYCAPERARASGLGKPCPATKASDIWSTGMVLFWLLTGQVYIYSFEDGE